MGRETFLAKFIWEDEWPVVNPGVGMLTEKVEIDLPEWDPEKDPDSYTCRTGHKTTIPGTDKDYQFASMKELGDEFLFLRNYQASMYKITPDGLKLRCGKEDIKAVGSPSYICIRQQHHHFTSSSTFDTSSLNEGESAGLVLMQNNLYNLRAEVIDGECRMILCQDGKDEVIGKTPVSGTVTVSVVVDGLNTKVLCDSKELGEASVANLSTEVAGGFVGCCIGIYASANGKDSDTYVTFKDLTYTAN